MPFSKFPYARKRFGYPSGAMTIPPDSRMRKETHNFHLLHLKAYGPMSYLHGPGTFGVVQILLNKGCRKPKEKGLSDEGLPAMTRAFIKH